MVSELSRYRRLFLAGTAAALLGLTGCATFSSKTEPLRVAYAAAQFPAAENIVNKGIAEETGAAVDLVARSNALDPVIDPQNGDALVYFLDKGMIRLAQEDPATAVRVLRRSRDTLDANFQNSTADLMREFASLLTDDTVLRYHGADYEHIMVRVMLALSDLISGGGDAFSYAVQIGEKQEAIIGSPLGEVDKNGAKEGYRPRQQYRRVGLGAYLQGIIREDSLEMDEAARAYERAISFSDPPVPLYMEALARVTGKRPSEPGQGALHVFTFGGVAPYLVESRSNPTSTAIQLASLAAFLLSKNFAFLGQAPVPVPQVQVVDRQVPPFVVFADGITGTGETVLDLNRIAGEQLDANMPWIMARAILRRAAKTAIAATTGRATGRGVNNDGVGSAVSLLVNLASTATENADTRSWTTLPATIQAARISLPAGEQTVRFGYEERRIRIAPGRNSYVVVINPSLGEKPVILVDRFSRANSSPN